MTLFTIISNYEEAAMRTAKDMGSDKMNLIHAALGLTSDSGEFATAIKSHAVYNKELDFDNAIEELGDCLWFIALACKTLNTSMSAVMSANIEKLAKRYPNKYSDEAAIARADKLGTNIPEHNSGKSELSGTMPKYVVMDDLVSMSTPNTPSRLFNLGLENNKQQEQTATQHNNMQRIMNEAGNVLYFVSPKQMDAMNYKYCYGPFSSIETAEVLIENKPERILTTISRGTIDWSEWFLKAGWVPA